MITGVAGLYVNVSITVYYDSNETKLNNKLNEVICPAYRNGKGIHKL